MYYLDLKKRISSLEKSGVVYKFRCDCKHTYIGETYRQLRVRASEHGMRSYKTEIFNHISGCSEYNANLLEFDPDPGPKK